MPKFRRREQDPAAVSQQAPTPFEVHVTAEGDCSVAGMPVLAAQDEALHDAVLNYLHRLAMATGHGVHATVHDARSGYTVPIEVQLDGSSRLTGQPEYASPRGPDAAGGPAPAPSPTPEGLPDPTGAVVPQQTPGEQRPGRRPPRAQKSSTGRPAPPPHAEPTPPPEAAPEPAPAPEAAPAQRPEQPAERQPATPGGEFERPGRSVPAPQQQVPPAFAEAVSRINEAIAMGRVEFAAATAQRTLDSVAQEFGADHPHVLQLQELCAHIAYLAGDPARSMAISLEVSRARMRQGGTGAYDALLRAAAVWPAIRDPRQGLEYGGQLLELWYEFVRTDERASAERDKLEAAEQRMQRLHHRAAASGAEPTAPPGPRPEEPHP
jgi:hypothetical protein